MPDSKLRQVRLPTGGFIEGVPDDLSDEDAIALLTVDETAQIRPSLVRSPEEQRAAGVSSQVPGQSAGAAAGRRLRLSQRTGVDVRPGQVEDKGARFAAGALTVNTLFERGEVVRKAMDLTDDDIIFFENIDDPSDSTVLVNVPGEGWKELNAPDFTSWADFIEASAGVVNLTNVGSIGAFATVAGKFPGSGVIPRVAASAIGAIAGFFGQSELARLRGEEQTSRKGVRSQALFHGLLAAGGDAVGEALRGVGMFGQGLSPHVPPGVARVVQTVGFLRKRGAKELIGPSPADISPIAGTVANGMAAQTGLRAQVGRLERFHGILRLIQRERAALMKDGGRDFSLAEVERIVGGWTNKLLETVRTPLRMLPAMSADLTLAGLRAWEQGRTLLHDKLFTVVRKIVVDQDVKLLTGPFKSRAARIKQGIIGEVKGGAAAASDKKRGKAILFDAQGRPVVRAGDEELRYQTLVGPGSELGDMIDQFLKLPDEVSNILHKGSLSTSYDQLRGLRTRVFNLMDSADPVQNKIATQFHAVLTEAMESPVGGNRAYRFALRKANAARTFTERAQSRFHTRELARALRADPEKLGREMVTLAHPGRVRDLKGIFTSSGQPEKFEMVRQGWMGQILDDPTTAAKTLDAWKAEAPQAFRLLLSESEEAGVRQFTESALKISEGPIGALIQLQTNLGKMAIEAIESGDTELITRVLDQVGGKNSPMGKQMQAGVWGWIIDKATFKDITIEVINPKTVSGRIQLLRSQPGWRDIMSVKGEGMGRRGPDDISADEIAETIVDLISIFPKEPTAGVGIATAQLASGFFSSGIIKAQIRKSRNAFLNFTLNSTLARKAMAGRAGFEAKANLLLSVEGGPVRRATVKSLRFVKSAAHKLAQSKAHNDIGYIRALGIATSIAMHEAKEDAVELLGPDAEPTPLIQLNADQLEDLINEVAPSVLQIR